MMADVPPMGRREVVAMVLALGIGGMVGIALFAGYIPGLKANSTLPSTVTIDGRSYYWTDASLPFPIFPANTSSPVQTTFHNVTFHLWVTGWYQTVLGFLHGNASTINGTVYGFVLGGPTTLPGRTTEFLAPGDAWGAYWNGQLFAQLYVLVPPAP